MNEADFINRWHAEKASYEAWGRFICDEVEAELKKELGLAFVGFIKIPPKPRLKEDNSLLGKAFHRNKAYADPYENIEDKVGLRFVVLLAADINRISKIVQHSQSWTFSLDKDFEEDRTNRPLEFSYQSKHYVVRAAKEFHVDGVKVAQGTPCELQIRTLLQHAHSELTHDNIYKREPGSDVSKRVERTVAKSMALIEAVDDFFELALAELAEANLEERQALQVMAELYQEFVGLPPLLDKTNALVLSAFKRELGSQLRADLTTLLRQKTFIADLIRDRYDRQFVFRQPWILLAYLLVSTRPNTVKDNWPLTLDEVEMVFVDLGKPFR